MAAFDQGELAKYNSLTDRHLVTYFSNDRMRQHLLKSGLITKSGEVVPDAVYRVRMARREHRRRVRDLIAQAIIHKALEMERSRQIDIRKKIEEIAKIELVRRVREDRSRIGDEDCISYFNPGVMDATPRGNVEKKRDIDESPMPMTTDEKSRIRLRKLLPSEEIESKHLSQLDSLTLGEYSKIMQKQDRERINRLPYLGLGQSINRQKRKQFKVKKVKKKPLAVIGGSKEEISLSSRSIQSKVQSLTKLSILFHSPISNRVYEIMVEQQPSGGNTVTLFRDTLTSNSVFSLISQRHKGFPFSLTFYINNVKDSRISTCCEYRHKVGKRIGGPNGHFSLFGVEGASPCYRCLTEQDMVNDRKINQLKDSKTNEHKITRSKSSSVQDVNESPYPSENEFESESSSEQSSESESEEKSQQENVVENFNNNAIENKSKTANEQVIFRPSSSSENKKPLPPLTGITKVTIVSKEKEQSLERKSDINETVIDDGNLVKENKPEPIVSTDKNSNIKPMNKNPVFDNDVTLNENKNPEIESENIVEPSQKQENKKTEVIINEEKDNVDVDNDATTGTSNKSQNKEKTENENNGHVINRDKDIIVTQIRKNSKQDLVNATTNKKSDIIATSKASNEPLNRKMSASSFSSNSSDSEKEKPVTKKRASLTNLGDKLKINIGKETYGNSNDKRIRIDRKYSLQNDDLMRKRHLLKKDGSLSSLRKNSGNRKPIGLTVGKSQKERKVPPSPVAPNSSGPEVEKTFNKASILTLNNENKLEAIITNEDHHISAIPSSKEIDISKYNSLKVDNSLKDENLVRKDDNEPLTSLRKNSKNQLLEDINNKKSNETIISKSPLELEVSSSSSTSDDSLIDKPQLKRKVSSSSATSNSSDSSSEKLFTKPDVSPLNIENKLETDNAKENHSVVVATVQNNKNDSPRLDEPIDEHNEHFIKNDDNIGDNNLRKNSEDQLLEDISDERLENFLTDKPQLEHKVSSSSATSDSSASGSKETIVNVDASAVDNENKSEGNITKEIHDSVDVDKNDSPRFIDHEKSKHRRISDLSNNEDDDLFSSSSASKSSSSNTKPNDSDIRSRLIPVKPDANGNRDELKINLTNDSESSKPSTSYGHHNVRETEEPLSIGRGKSNVLVEETNDEIREHQDMELSTSSSSSEYETDSDTNDLINVDNQIDETTSFPAHPDSEAKPPESIKICVEGDDINFKKAKEICQQFNGASIDSIKIRNCELPNYVFNFISDKLETHSELKSIELSGCEVEISLLNLLAKSLEKWANLEQLILADNHFTDYSFQNLIDMIKFLYHNDGNSDGFIQNMKLLDLSNCSIQENDLGQLIDMIDKNTRLEMFVLDGTHISSTMLQSVYKALQNNKHIQVLSLQNSGINQTTLDRLGDEFTEDIKMKLKI